MGWLAHIDAWIRHRLHGFQSRYSNQFCEFRSERQCSKVSAKLFSHLFGHFPQHQLYTLPLPLSNSSPIPPPSSITISISLPSNTKPIRPHRLTQLRIRHKRRQIKPNPSTHRTRLRTRHLEPRWLRIQYLDILVRIRWVLDGRSRTNVGFWRGVFRGESVETVGCHGGGREAC